MGNSIEKWLGNPYKLSESCGSVMAEYPQFLDNFNISFSQSLFKKNQINKRIQFLYQQKESDFLTFRKHDFSYIACIKDDKVFPGINVMLIRFLNNNQNAYSIRTFDKDNFEKNAGMSTNMNFNSFVFLDTTFDNVANGDFCWNFLIEKGSWFFEADGFLNPVQSRRVVLLICHISNYLGYSD